MRFRVAIGALAGVLGCALVASTAAAAPDGIQIRNQTNLATDAPVNFHDWSTYRQWLSGDSHGVVANSDDPANVEIGRPAGTVKYTDPHTGEKRSWEYGVWTSPRHDLNFGASELVASWNATTPAGTWLQVEMQGEYDNGKSTPWFVMGRWAAGDADIKRTTVDKQGDAYSSIWTDTFSIDDPDRVRLSAYQLRLTMYRAPGSDASPEVRMLGAMSSYVPDRFGVEPSQGGIAWGTELVVPRHSQNIHRGNYPEYGGGGQVWCSPTSTTMVLEYWGRGPSEDDMSWVEPGYVDPQVAHAARMTWDYTYEGAGNWPFNTAYASSFRGMEGRITRLHSLDEVELFIKAGIPVITSQSFLEEELPGAGYGTSGHIFVVVGFTSDGDVIVNDPASSSNDAVRNVYPREDFEKIWLRTKRHRADGSVAGGSGGIVYLIKP
ncbi:MAG: peptidase C39 family protein, partial [Micromonosporaceae bacterium]